MCLLPPYAASDTWRFGGGLGFGGTGITKQVKSGGGTRTVLRSEGPGMMHVFIDRLISDNWTLAFESSRGFRLGPFTSDMGFYGSSLRWHYVGPAPEPLPKVENTQLMIKRWSPYTGFTTGIAAGSISRESDEVSTVSGSGIYFGLRNGVDILYRPDMGLRLEISYSSTFFQAKALPALLTEFSLWAGVFIPAF